MRIERWMAAALVAFSFGAHAASFDCGLAKSPVEKAICADSRLGQIDQEISDTYFKIDGDLDHRFRDRFRSAQRAWLKERVGASDLKAFMTDRLTALKNAFVSVNSVTFFQVAGKSRPPYLLTQLPGANRYNKWVDEIWSESVSDHADDERMKKCDAFYNALDAHSIERMQSKIDEKCDGLSSTNRNYEIDFASPELISVHEATSEDGWHTAHPSNSDVHHNWWLSKSGEIKSDEIFSTNDYAKVIKQHVSRHLVDDYGRSASASNTITNPALDPKNWALTPKFLRITGQGYDYEVGRGFVQVDIPWKAFSGNLKPSYLAIVQSAPVVTDPRLVFRSQ